MATEPVTDFKFAIEGTAASVPETEASTTRLIGITTDDEAVTLQVSADYVGDLVSDPYSTGITTPQIARWTNTMFPSDVGVGVNDGLTASTRRARLQTALTQASTLGKEFLFPAKHGYVYEIDNNISLRGMDGVVIHLEGDLYNSTPISAEGGQNQTVFKQGNYHPTYLRLTGSNRLTWFTCGSPVLGASSVTLDSGTNRTDGLAALAVGDLIILRSAAFYLAGAANTDRPDWGQMAEITAIDSGTGVISLSQTLDESVTDCYIAKVDDDNVLDLQGEPLFAAKNISITGPGRIGSVGSAIARTAMYQNEIHLGEIYGESAFYGALFCYTNMSFDNITINGKLADVSCLSHYSNFNFGHCTFEGPGEGVNMTLIAENSRYIKIKGHSLLAGEYADGVIVALLTSRKVDVDIDHVVAPAVTASAISINNALYSGSGQTQPRSHDQSVRFGTFVTGNSGIIGSFVDMGNDGGQLLRPKVTGTFLGVPTTRAATILGTEADISDAYFENGEIRLSGTTQAKMANTFAAGGISYATTTYQQNRISGMDSISWRTFRALSADATPNTTITSTTVGNDIVSFAIPAATIVALDRVTCFISGRVTGTNDAKNIQITDDTGALITLSLLAAFTGAFSVELVVNVSSNTIYMATARAVGTGLSAVLTDTRRTGLDLTTNGRTITYEAWVSNASDSIIIDSYRFIPSRAGHVTANAV